MIDYQDIYINLDFDPKTDEQISVVEKVEGKNYISVHRLLNADVTDLMDEYDRETLKRASAFKNKLTNYDFSTITITLREVKNFVPEGPPTLATQVSRSFGNSLDALKAFFVGLLLLAVALVPWVVPLGLAGWLVYKFALKRRPRG